MAVSITPFNVSNGVSLLSRLSGSLVRFSSSSNMCLYWVLILQCQSNTSKDGSEK